jgi:hypothetical protein
LQEAPYAASASNAAASASYDDASASYAAS